MDCELIGFFTNIEGTKEFYETAADLAGDRWFNAHLKNQEINWELTFVDIEKNGEASSAYQYKETYVRSAESVLESMLVGNRFHITIN